MDIMVVNHRQQCTTSLSRRGAIRIITDNTCLVLVSLLLLLCGNLNSVGNCLVSAGFGSRVAAPTTARLLAWRQRQFCSDPLNHIRQLPPSVFGTSRQVVVASAISGRAGDDDGGGGVDQQQQQQPEVAVIGVVAPLKYVGPYPCLSLRFPKHRDKVLTFLLDTGANINSVKASVVTELKLPLLFRSKDLLPSNSPLHSIGMGGEFDPGDVYLLGDSELDGLPEEQGRHTFLRNMTAVAFPQASPVGDGLLSTAFFQSFPAGVEFDWHGTDGDPPTLIFYFGDALPDFAKTEGLTPSPLLGNNITHVLSLMINVNGTDVPALLDTGSPITVLNSQAAQQAGIETVAPPSEMPMMMERHSPQIGDEVLIVGGIDHRPVQLFRSQTPVSIRTTQGTSSLGTGWVYVGELPGMALMGGILDGTTDKPPAVVLGLDFLRRTHRMVFSVPKNEVWIEVLKG